MSPRARTSLLVVLIGTGALTGVLVLRPAHAPSLTETATPPRSPNDARSLTRGDGCAFHVGDALAYDVKVSGKATVHPERMGIASDARDASATPSLHQATARLALEVLETSDTAGATLVARFEGAAMPGVEGDLSAPFLVRVGRTCALTGFARHTQTPVVTARAQQSLVYELAFTWAAGSGAPVDVEGDNAVGHYRASYDVKGAGAGAVVESSSRVYARLWGTGASDDVARAELIPSESTVRVESGGGPWFARLRRHEVLSGTGALDTDVTTDAVAVEPRPRALGDAPHDTASYRWENLLPRMLRLRERREVTERDLRARAAVKDTTLADQVSGLVARSRSPMNFAETWPALATYLEARPDAVAPLVAELRRDTFPAEGRAGAWLALGGARNPEARDALMGVVRDASSRPIDRSRAVFAMVDRDDVGVAFARELGGYASGISTGASRGERVFARESALALGMMAGLRGETDREVHAEAMGTLKTLLASQTTAKSLHAVFGAIGNVGDPETLAWIAPYTRHADPDVRAGAAQAIRRLQPAETTELTASWLAREQDLDVKRAIYTTVAKQTHDAHLPAEAPVLDRAIADLKSHPGVITRRAILHILGKASRTYPPAHAALVEQAGKEIAERSGLYATIAPYVGADEVIGEQRKGGSTP